MHGISKRKHEHLVEALMLLEQLLNKEEETAESLSTGPALDDMPTDFIATGKAVEKVRVELQDIFELYTSTLSGLSVLINRYEDLYNYSRTAYLAKVLKELRRKIHPEDEGQFQSMRENIHAVYKT